MCEASFKRLIFSSSYISFGFCFFRIFIRSHSSADPLHVYCRSFQKLLLNLQKKARCAFLLYKSMHLFYAMKSSLFLFVERWCCLISNDHFISYHKLKLEIFVFNLYILRLVLFFHFPFSRLCSIFSHGLVCGSTSDGLSSRMSGYIIREERKGA